MSKPPQQEESKSLVPDNLRDRLESLIGQMTDGLVERDREVRLAMLAMLSGEHLLLIGPPGTAKSEVARRLTRALGDGQIFERLLTRFSVPEDIFGPLSIQALENDRYERKTDGYLPTASVAFVDEIFKANSAILNALLTLLNERKFDNGTERQDAPLLALVGASNELPQDEVLQALYDRFLVRCHVSPVSDDGFQNLMRTEMSSEQSLDGFTQLSRAELREIKNLRDDVDLPENIIDTLANLRKFLDSHDIYVSDRRWMKAVKLLKTAALTNGQQAVTFWDCWLLQHCLWNEPEEQALIQDWYNRRSGADSRDEPGRFQKLVSSYETLLSTEKNSKSRQTNEEGTPPLPGSRWQSYDGAQRKIPPA